MVFKKFCLSLALSLTPSLPAHCPFVYFNFKRHSPILIIMATRIRIMATRIRTDLQTTEVISPGENRCFCGDILDSVILSCTEVPLLPKSLPAWLHSLNLQLFPCPEMVQLHPESQKQNQRQCHEIGFAFGVDRCVI